MRVFVLCTGRSGSTTFTRACQRIENYTALHESRARLFGPARFAYPDNHIEADNRMAWHLGQLNEAFGRDAYYVHLKRDRQKTAQSFYKRFFVPGSIIDTFCEGIRMTPPERLSKDERMQACYDYVDTIDANIADFMADKPRAMTLELEHIQRDFPSFWNDIGAEGDLGAALAEFDKKRNASKKPGANYLYRLKSLAIKEWKYFLITLRG